MTTEAISADVFLREFTRELHNKNAAVFAGAGLSMASGYVDWKGLLTELIRDLGLNPDKEHDLVTLAQYHCNQSGGNRAKLTQTLVRHFAATKAPTANHHVLASLPIHTYWTTNYDKLIEKALEEAKKVADVKYTVKQLPVTRPDRDVVVYKMHGDIDHAADAVICKDDYEAYPLKMAAFVAALRGDLVEKTFLFLGFSFSDPNIDYILSRVRVQYEQHQRQHYSIQRVVSKGAGEDEADFKSRRLKQSYFIHDLKRFGIQTVLVDEYSQITDLLRSVASRYKRSSILISGAAEVYGAWPPQEAAAFLHNLSQKLAASKKRVVTGFGVGVGSAVINGVLEYLSGASMTVSDEHIVMRPFPQIATGAAALADQWSAYRRGMIDHAGIALFVFGNKRGQAGDVIPSNGVREEFEIAMRAGVYPLPVGATGFVALELWHEVWAAFDKYYPKASASFRKNFELLGDESKRATELLPALEALVAELQER